MVNRTRSLVAVAAFLIAAPVLAQMGMRPPDVRVMVWNPTVGQGSEYENKRPDGQTNTFAMSVVSKEDVDGKPGYWLETAMNTPEMGLIYAQILMTTDAVQMHTAKIVVQMPNMPPMIMPSGMAGMGRGNSAPRVDPESDYRKNAERVGTETITTPAGSFDCDHWRAKDGSGDAWISSKVVPFSLVKMTDKDGSIITLMKQITDAKSHLTGTPVPFDPTMFMGRGRRGQ
ncbi:MAG TPA: hypothetical protein VFO34_05375 [Candidatus Acidoferrales bacterium]|nr:hypothetical protein [Candidatus Acidoferrales bacterium]